MTPSPSTLSLFLAAFLLHALQHVVLILLSVHPDQMANATGTEILLHSRLYLRRLEQPGADRPPALPGNGQTDSAGTNGLYCFHCPGAQHPTCIDAARRTLAGWGLLGTRAVIWVRVLICLGCCNKMPQVGWLQQQKLISSQLWRLEVLEVGFSLGPLACRWLPSRGVLSWPSLCAHVPGSLCAPKSPQDTSQTG